MSALLSRFGLARAPEPPRLVQTASPTLAGAEMAVAYFSEGEGGDFFEFVRVAPHRVLFGLMDVAGRRKSNQGICSATQHVFCSSGMELLAADDVNESEAMIELAHRMNAAIMRTAGGVCSSSVFMGCYNEEIGTVCYVNAGHTPGLLRDDHSTVELPATGLPLGLFSLSPADARTVGLGRQAAMAIFSRGVVEAERRGQEFGMAGVQKVIEAEVGSATNLSRRILEGVQEFVHAVPRHNDVTALAITRGYSGN
jgi:sigma-B regulation protein RsbU (phosphoserine phosphatase)